MVKEEKERLVAASLEPGVSVSEVARSAGIHVSQRLRWRRDLWDRVDAGSSQLVPVEIVFAVARLPLRCRHHRLLRPTSPPEEWHHRD
ncbi:transposase [Mesorhizobium sp. M0500]|uniref:transposase n=1 Tax=Mesorhizobium sp. M0500 TaxID=2956953 RepID=UPI003338F7D3